MRRPREFKVPQTRDSYYYIDAVSVIALGHLEEPCDCKIKEADGPNLDVVYTHNVSEGIEGTTEEKIEHIVVHFDKGASTLSEGDRAKADDAAALLLANPGLKIMVVGHTAEAEDYDLSIARAKSVFTYLVTQKKVNANSVDYAGKGFDEPKNPGNDAHANAENRRVEFKVK